MYRNGIRQQSCAFLYRESVVSQMAKRKYEYWLSTEGLLKLGAWARDGLTDEQIAENIGISRSTLNEWKKNYPDISDTLKRGKEIVDIEVENALLNNARGFTYTEQVVATKKEYIYENGRKVKEISEPVVVTVERYKQPETTAQIFWLKNRRPDNWRDKQEVQVSGALETEKSKLDELIKQMNIGT